MRIGIIQFPGSNCERETRLAVLRAGMTPVDFLWNQSRELLKTMDGFVIVGGFSYEDRSRAGIIAALDPVMQELRIQNEMDKPILGICNGAQILVETGLVPGVENNKVVMALSENKRITDGKVIGTGFYNTWIHMRAADEYQRNAFTKYVNPKSVLHIPIAHAEGRFLMSDALLQEIKAQGLNVFQYCDGEGFINENFPINPNGSINNIAAISNKRGNVMAMMPHPERTQNGDVIFQSMRDFILEKRQEEVVPLYYYPRPSQLQPFKKDQHSYECLVELIINDNQARTVENTLQQLGYNVSVRCQTHWEIAAPEALLSTIKNSGVLFNDRKEMETLALPGGILVRAKEDLIGLQKHQMLKNHYHIQDLMSIKRSLIWYFEHLDGTMTNNIDSILSTHIIHNPYAHECYQYS